MTAPAVNFLVDKLPALRLTLQSDHPNDFLASRYKGPFEQIGGPDDFGLAMVSATEIDLEKSASAYRALHERLDQAVTEQATRMLDLGVDLVLANIGYVPLLAARQAGIPAIALSCLNWADIYGHYFSAEPEAAAMFGMKPYVLRDARLRGEISGSKIGKRIFYSRDELLKLLARNQAESR